MLVGGLVVDPLFSLFWTMFTILEVKQCSGTYKTNLKKNYEISDIVRKGGGRSALQPNFFSPKNGIYGPKRENYRVTLPTHPQIFLCQFLIYPNFLRTQFCTFKVLTSKCPDQCSTDTDIYTDTRRKYRYLVSVSV